MPEVLDVLDTATAAGLLSEVGQGYQFSHALVRETVYADLPAGRRTQLHAEVADALQSRLFVDPELRTEVAHHFWLAAPLDPAYATKAVEHLTVAARTADARNAFDESTALWSQALTASALTGRDDPLVRYGLLVELSIAELRVSEMAGARDHVAEAVQIARTLQRWDLVAEAATALTGAGVWSWREFGTTDETMINALQQCLTRLPDGPLAARVLACLQMENYYGRRVAEADAYGRRSVQMARETGDPLVLLQVLLVRGLATYAPGTHGERLAMAEEMLSLPLPGESEVSVLWQYGSALQQAARSDEAEMIMDRCQTVASRLRHTGADIPLAWWWFMIAVKSDASDRRQVGEAALDLHRRSTVVAMDELIGIFAVRSAEPGVPVPADVVSRAPSSLSAGYRALVGYAMVEAGDVEGALSIMGPDAAEEARDYGSLASDCLRAGVYAAGEQLPQLRESLRRIMPWSGDVVTYGTVDHLGAVDFFIALGLVALDDHDRARAHALAAAELCDRVHNLPWARRARELLTALG